MSNLSASHTMVAVLTLATLWIVHKLYSRMLYKAAIRRNKCQEPVWYPHKDPIFGLDLFMKKKTAFETDRFLKFQKSQFDAHGKTYKAKSFGTTVITTMDPENSKAVLSKSFDKFGIQPLRYKVAKNLWGNGIVVVNGPAWSHARALIRSSFDIVHVANFDRLVRHVDRFMDLIPRDNSTVDLLPLFKRLTINTSSEFIFGESMEAHSSSSTSDAFMDSFSYAQRGTGLRSMLGWFRFLHRDKKWWQACKNVTDFCDQHVEKALARRLCREQDRKTDKTEHATQSNTYAKRLRLVDEMTKETQDPIDLRYQILSAFSPAHDGAAVILSNTFFHLARKPDVWTRLRAEILLTKDEPRTYELLKSYKYLDHVFREAHRLTPIVTMNQRICLADTVLPTGGGIYANSPVFVRKGEVVELNYLAMMHSTAIWGEDAQTFRPERWETARPTWEYTPFGGGPRICPGQRLVFTESGYVIVRILREFRALENREPELEWQEKMRLTFQSKNGTQVALIAEETAL